MTTPQTTYEVNLPDLTTSELLVDLLAKFGAKVSGELSAEQAARINGDAALSQALSLLGDRVTVLEQRPDELTPAERQVIEEALQRLVTQEGFASLIGGMSVTIGGVSYSATSVILSMLAARKIARHDYADLVGYLHRTYRVTFTDDTVAIFSASAAAKTAEELSAMLGRQIANAGAHYLYEAADFGGVPARFELTFEHVPVQVAGISSERPTLLRKTNIVALLPGFAASAPVVLAGVDMTGDGVIGVPAAAPVDDPLVAALAVLAAAVSQRDAAASVLAQAQGEATAAADALPAAQAARTAADAAYADQYPGLIAAADVASADLVDAQVLASSAQQADADQQALVTAAEQQLAAAQASGDEQAVADAQAALLAAQEAKALSASELTAAQQIEQAAAQALAAAQAAAQALADARAVAASSEQSAQQRVTAAAAAVDAAQQSLTSAQAAVDAAQAAVDALQPASSGG